MRPHEAPEIVIVRTGAANLASVCAACRRAGLSPRLSVEPRDVDEAALLVLPGVGAFGPAAENLERFGLWEPLRRRAAEGRAMLAICLGMQLLFEASEESPGVSGLGVLPGRVTRFPDSERVPQLGWNRVVAPFHAPTLRTGDAAFANSFRITTPPPGAISATTDYAGPFVAALERSGLLACQFHPELSGAFGLLLIRRWAAACLAAPRSAKEAAPC